MNTNLEPIKNWFGYSRRERRSSFILLLILAIVIMIRYAEPKNSITAEDVTSSILSYSKEVTTDQVILSSNQAPFFFNPNTASFDTLIRLGLSEREASTLLSYRRKGGRFRAPSDLKKVYGLDSVKAVSLLPFVLIEPDTMRKQKPVGSRISQPLIDLNNCDSAALVSLPGIGPVLSGRIIRYRHLLGGFARVEQLKEVYGLKEETFDLIAARLTADSSIVSRIDINTAGFRELSKLPYFERYEITAILKYRELQGVISEINDLVDNKIITYEKSIKLQPYLKFGK
jgi:DNA uptake protein ComE-like DNA-binding protein